MSVESKKAYRRKWRMSPKGQAYTRRWAAARRKAGVLRDATNRAKCLHHYGPNCERCGHDDQRALVIDHIKQNGTEHRQTNGKRYTGSHLYRWLIRNKYPKGFRTLCCNCNAVVFREHLLKNRG